LNTTITLCLGADALTADADAESTCINANSDTAPMTIASLERGLIPPPPMS
jgi:hypothetical protein